MQARRAAWSGARRIVNRESQSLPARGAWWGALALLAVAALVVFVRLRLLQIPLERDEGEFACAGPFQREMIGEIEKGLHGAFGGCI